MSLVTLPQSKTIDQLDYLDFHAPTQVEEARGRHGGYRPGAGRPKGSKSWKTKQEEDRRTLFHKALVEHVLGKEKVSYIDKDGNMRTKRRTRLLLILDTLFHTAMQATKPSDRLSATKEYLNRTVGKPGYMADHYSTERLAREASANNRQGHLAAKEALERPASKAEIAAAIAYHKACIDELREKLDSGILSTGSGAPEQLQ